MLIVYTWVNTEKLIRLLIPMGTGRGKIHDSRICSYEDLDLMFSWCNEDLEKLNESQEKKTTAMNLMNLIEEIKDEGMNDKRYMDIMDQLMILHKQDEKRIHALDTFNEFTQRIPIINEGRYNDWRIGYRDMMFRNPPTYEFINNGVINTDYNDIYNVGLPVNDGHFEDPEDVN